MKRWALMRSGVCENVIEKDSAPDGDEWLEVTGLVVGPGSRYVGGQWLPPATLAWSDPDLDPRYFWVDKGPFFDRFGVKALGIVSSTDPVVQGLVTLILPRNYIDLKRADLPGMLDVLIAKGLINADDKAAVLSPQTTDYERHIKGLPQPA